MFVNKHLGYYLVLKFLICCQFNFIKFGPKIGVVVAVSKRNFSFISDDKIENLRQIQLKKKIEKM